MRHFKDGDTIVIEPWRARAFPVIKDLVVDRSAFDRIIQAGGFISSTPAGAGGQHAPGAARNAEQAMDAAACIGCGACVAACPNASAMLFVCAKVSQLALLPQGRPEPPGASWAWCGPWTPGFRQLLQPPRMRSRLPQGDLHRQHRPAEP